VQVVRVSRGAAGAFRRSVLQCAVFRHLKPLFQFGFRSEARDTASRNGALFNRARGPNASPCLEIVTETVFDRDAGASSGARQAYSSAADDDAALHAHCVADIPRYRNTHASSTNSRRAPHRADF
jgi:hypothetical protein